MRTVIGRLTAWLALLVILTEVNARAYALIVVLPFYERGGAMEKGADIDPAMLLGVSFLSFFASGYVLSWVMRNASSSIAWSMALGWVWGGLDLAFGFPWYQLLPSHPTRGDHLVAFTGAICAPASASLGAVLARSLHKVPA